MTWGNFDIKAMLTSLGIPIIKIRSYHIDIISYLPDPAPDRHVCHANANTLKGSICIELVSQP